MKKIPENFGTNVHLEDFYDYNQVCLDKLTNVYDTIQYAISQYELVIKDKEPNYDEAKVELTILKARRDIVLRLINHIDRTFIPQFMKRQEIDLRDRLHAIEHERECIMKRLGIS